MIVGGLQHCDCLGNYRAEFAWAVRWAYQGGGVMGPGGSWVAAGRWEGEGREGDWGVMGLEGMERGG